MNSHYSTLIKPEDEHLKNDKVGKGFQQNLKGSPGQNLVRVNMMGQIRRAIDFDCEDIYIQWELFLPNNFKVEEDEFMGEDNHLSSSCTQLCRYKQTQH